LIICHCRKVSDLKIEEISKKVSSLNEVIKKTGASSCCGICERDVESIYQNAKKCEEVNSEDAN